MYKHPTFLPIEETTHIQMYEFPNGAAVCVVAKKLPNTFDVQVYDFRDPKKIIYLGNSMEAGNHLSVSAILDTAATMTDGDF